MRTSLGIRTQNMRFLSQRVLPVSQENEGFHQPVPINTEFPVEFICLGVMFHYTSMYGIELHVCSITGCHHMICISTQYSVCFIVSLLAASPELTL